MTSPLGVVGVGCCGVVDGEGLIWYWLGAVEIPSKVIAIEQSMDLKVPCHEVGGIEFGYINHVNVEK